MMCTPHRARCLFALAFVAATIAAALPAAAQPELTYGEYRDPGLGRRPPGPCHQVRAPRRRGRHVRGDRRTLRHGAGLQDRRARGRRGSGRASASAACPTRCWWRTSAATASTTRWSAAPTAARSTSGDWTDYALVWESLPGEYQTISCFTTANVDEDAARRDRDAGRRQHLLRGRRQLHHASSRASATYAATMVRCGDVDGDGRMEIVLNTRPGARHGVPARSNGRTRSFYVEDRAAGHRRGRDAGDPDRERVRGADSKVFDGDYRRARSRFQ